jgi:hypothetical protein
MAQPSRKLRQADLRPELLRPEMRAILIAYTDVLASRMRIVKEYRARGYQVDLLDAVVNLHVLIWSTEGGTRQQTLIDALAAPRTTVRNSFARLEKLDLICRDDGVYFSTEKTADLANALMPITAKPLGRLCDAINLHRARYGPFSP